MEAFTCLGFLSISNPQTIIFPFVLDTVPPKIFKKGVLPAPFGPNNPNTSPCLTLKFSVENYISK